MALKLQTRRHPIRRTGYSWALHYFMFQDSQTEINCFHSCVNKCLKGRKNRIFEYLLNLTSPVVVNITFPGLMSLWTMPLSCKYFKPSRVLWGRGRRPLVNQEISSSVRRKREGNTF